jgi:hypothetical protein
VMRLDETAQDRRRSELRCFLLVAVIGFYRPILRGTSS